MELSPQIHTGVLYSGFTEIKLFLAYLIYHCLAPGREITSTALFNFILVRLLVLEWVDYIMSLVYWLFGYCKSFSDF